ncbi:uncharacterized protein SPSK_01549 [Sporothrix schenckii 1099-18]|uniref:DUF7580 domain-containing protein n=1 Tax=Sporothrix schenckii 1099-18 TaxID=1397361 RepID=A0A0F2MCZ2_SPOSC|nr:uncharacterized protein SPSK_01549 [Sporothrix schenckii 1099-18]KJR87558.1 hypothetical protein SPSK_01549 [Sporothrix schenckii 1099-18]
MAEIAGLVLGGLPLVISAVEVFAEPLESYRNYKKQVLQFHSLLALQRQKLEATLLDIGLDTPSKDELSRYVQANAPKVADEILYIYQCIEEETNKVMRKFGIDSRTKVTHCSQGVLQKSRVQEEEVRSHVHDAHSNLVFQFHAIPRSSPSDMKRIWNAISAKRRKKTISLLNDLNEQLCGCLQVSKSELKAEDDNPVVQRLVQRFDIKQCNSLRQCLASLHRALESSLLCGCEAPHHAVLDVDWHLDGKAVAPDVKIAVSYQPGTAKSATQGAPYWRTVHAIPTPAKQGNVALPHMHTRRVPAPNSVSRSSTPPRTPSPPEFRPSRVKVGPPAPSSQLSLPARQPAINSKTRIAFYEGIVSVYESLTHSASFSPHAVPLEPLTQTITPPNLPVAASVCVFVSPDLSDHVLQDDDEDHGRDFRLQQTNVGGPRITQLVPITKALNPPQSHQRLSLKARCGLAAYAAMSVLHLSSGPWLTNDWDGSRVGIFFEQPDNNAERLADRPCFFSSFAPLPQTFLGDEGDHGDHGADGALPHAAGRSAYDKRLAPNITVFSLGILLVELCVGRCYADARDDAQQQQPLETPLSMTNARYDFAMSNLDKVYELAGASYGDAAKKCIRFSFPGPDSHNIFEMETFRGIFYRQVVAPIQAAYNRLLI